MAPDRGSDESATPLAWIRERMWLVDALVGASVFLYNLPIFSAFATGPLHAIALLLVSAVLCGAHLFRRRRPVAVLGIMLAAAFAHVLLGAPVLVVDVLLLFAVYTVASLRSRRISLCGAVLTAIWAITAIAPYLRLDYVNVGQLGVFILLVLWVWTWGVLVRTRRAHVAGLRERAEQAERAREAHARIAAADERTRIAREIHDIVSHGLGAVVVLSEGAAANVERDPDQARDAMLRVRDTGRTALADMRRMLGLLRAEEPGSQTPQPGLDRIAALVEHSQEAGVPAQLVIDGDSTQNTPIPEGVGLTAYRLVQEALTNVQRHAGPGLTAAEVLVTRSPTALEVRVIDDGTGTEDCADTADRAGHLGRGSAGEGFGLLGMRERVAGHGGKLTTGPRAGGGFEVAATLPLEGGP